MADFYKTSEEAGSQVRRLGQGVTPQSMYDVPSQSMYEEKPAEQLNTYSNVDYGAGRRRTAIGLTDQELQYKNQLIAESQAADQALLDSATKKPEDVTFGDEVAKSFKGVKVAWDFLANRLEHFVTGKETDTKPILEQSVTEYRNMVDRPELQEMIRLGDEAGNLTDAAKAMGAYALNNPRVFASLIAQQVGPVVASIPTGGVGGRIASTAAERVALAGVERGAIREAIAAGDSAAIAAAQRVAGATAAAGTAGTGAAINTAAVVYGSLGTNYVEGLDKFGGNHESAVEYATTKTLNEIPANAVAGGLVAVNPFTRFATKSPMLSAIGNTGFQINAQGMGGALGALQSGQSVGEDVGWGQLLTEYAGEALTGPTDLIAARREARAQAASQQQTPPTNQITAPLDTPPGVSPSSGSVVPGQDIQSFAADKEFYSGVKSPAFMAAMYSQATPEVQAQLQALNPNLNLAELSKDVNLVQDGLKIADVAPDFVQRFAERIATANPVPLERQASTQSTEAPFDGGTQVGSAPGEFIPVREKMRMAQEAAQEGQMIAEGTLMAPPAKEAENTAAPTGEENVPVAQQPGPLTQLSQAEQQIQSNQTPVQETVSQEAPIQQTEEAPAKVEPGTFSELRQVLKDEDKSVFNIDSKDTDYLELPVDKNIQELAKSLGINVFGYRYIGKQAKPRFRRGVSNKNGTIGLNANSEESHMFVFGHEVLHELARRNPAASEQLIDAAVKYLSKEGKAAYKQKLKEMGYSEKNFNEEIVADMMGMMFRDTEFWNFVNKRNPTLIEKIYAVIEDMLEKLGKASNRNKAIAKYTTDYEAVRNLLADFMANNKEQEAVQEVAQPEVAPAAMKEEPAPAAQESNVADGLRPVEATAKPAKKKKQKRVKFQEVANETPAPQVQEAKVEPQAEPEGKIEPSRQEPVAEQPTVQEAQVEQAPTPDVQTVEEEPKPIVQQTPKQGTYKPAPKPVSQDVVAQEARDKELKARRKSDEKDLAELNRMPYSDVNARVLIDRLTDKGSKGLGDSFAEKKADLLKDGQVVGGVFQAKRGGYIAVYAKPNGLLNNSFFPTLEMAVEKSGLEARRVSETQAQPSLELTGKPDTVRKYQAAVARVMTQAFTPSGAASTLAQLREAIKQEFKKSEKFFKFKKKARSDAEYIFEQFASVGAMEAGAKKQTTVAYDRLSGERIEQDKTGSNKRVAALARAIEAAQRGDVIARAGLMKVHAAKIMDALAELRVRMAQEGLNDTQINDIVGEQERGLQAIMDGQDAQEVRVETENQAGQDLLTPDLNTMELPGMDFSDEVAAANAVIDEIENGKDSPVTVIRRELNKGDRQFSFSHLRKAMAARGLDVSAIDREVLQWPAAQYSLKYWLKKNGESMGLYGARNHWYNSYEQIQAIYKDEPKMRAQFENELSEDEKRVIEYIRDQKRAVEMRRKEANEDSLDPKNVFPDALFNKYRLEDLRNDETIRQRVPEKERLALESLVRGYTKYLPRVWLDDVVYAMTARADIKDQILAGMTEDERVAVNKYMALTDTVIAQNLRQSELRSFQTELDNIEGLDKSAYRSFQKQMIYSDVKQIPSIIQAAQEVANLTTQAKSKKELGDLLNAYLNKLYHDDEMKSATVAENQGKFDEIESRELDEVTDAEISAYIERQERLGEPIQDSKDARDNIRNQIYFDRIAEQAVSAQEDYLNSMNAENSGTFTPEAAADAEFQPENTVGLGGDIRYKRAGSNYSSGPSNAFVTAHLAEITSQMPGKPNVIVRPHPAQIEDAEVRERLMARIPDGKFKGALDPETGAVYVFSSNLESLEDAEFVLFHELYGHWGMRAFLGKNLDTFLDTQYRVNPKIREAADALFASAKREGEPMSRLEAVEEVISDMAAEGNTSLFRELVGRLVAFFRKHGMDSVADWLDTYGDKELAYVLKQARTVARTQQGISPLDGAPDSVRYSADEKRATEVFAVRNNETVGYARIDPITGYWGVYTKAADGSFGYITVEDIEDVTAALKKIGTIVKSRANLNIEPGSIVQIPDHKAEADAKFLSSAWWAKQRRQIIMKAQNMYLPIFEVARFLDSKGIKNTVINDILLYEGRLKYFVDQYESEMRAPITHLLKQAGEKGATVEDVDTFLTARHAAERNGAIRALTEGKNPAGSGMSDERAAFLLDTNNDGKWDAFSTELEQIGELTDKMSQFKAAYMFETGLITKQQYNSITQFKHYINLSGNQELDIDKFDASVLGGRAFNLRGSDLIRATGRGTEAVDVLQNTMNSYVATLIRGQKNRPLQAIYSMLKRNPDPTFVTIEPIKEKKTVNTKKLIADRTILKAIGDAPNEGSGRQYMQGLRQRIADGEIDGDAAQIELIQRIQEAEARRDITPEQASNAIRTVNEQTVVEGALNPGGYVTMVEDPNLMRDPSVLVVKIDGKPHLMQFTGRGEEFVKAMSGIKIEERSSFIDAIGKWNRFFSQMVTTWNPFWVPINGIRDIQTAFSNAAADPRVGTELAKQMLKAWRDAIGVAFHYQVANQANKNSGFWGNRLKKMKTPSNEWQAAYESFRRNGAETFFLDRNNLEETIEKMNRHMVGGEGVLGTVKEKLDTVGDFMEVMTLPMETAPRLAMYKVLLDAGWSEVDAAVYAKELTVNFNMKGAASNIRSLYVFFNPAVQGTFRMFQNYSRGDKGIQKFLPSNQFAKVAGTWMMLGLLSNIVARALGGADDDREGLDKLDKVSDHKRATSLVLVPDMPGGAIPIAYGWNAIATAGSYLWDAMTGHLTPAQAAAKVAKTSFDAFAPMGTGADSKTEAGMLLKTFLPSPFVPLAEYGLNENRYNAPIRKGDTQFSDTEESDAYKHFRSVNPISATIAHGWSSIIGGSRYNDKMADFNPAFLDHMVNSYLPGVFSEIYKGAGLLIQKAQGYDTKEMDVPLVGRFTAKVPEQWDAQALRNAKTVIDTKYKALTAPDISDAEKKQILQDHPGILGARAIVSSTEQRIKTINKQLENVERSPRYSDEEKVNARNYYEELKKRALENAATQVWNAGFHHEMLNSK